MKTSDLIIIGAGPGGYEMAVEAAARGLNVTIFEEKHAGGTCLNEGCIPTKVLCRNAEVAATVRDASYFGIITEGVMNINMDAIQARRREVIDGLRAGVEGLLGGKGITFIAGHAEFRAPHVVTSGGEEYTAPHIVIATGSESRALPIEGMTLPGVLTSAEMLQIDHIPATLCVVGAGVIGVEFASIFARLGSNVTMVEYAKEILPPFDGDIAKRLRQSLTRQGIAINTAAAVTCIEQTDNGLRVNFEQKGKATSAEAEVVLVAVGRAPRVNALNLEAAGVEHSPRGIVVDDNMQTNVLGIYAVGDVNARCMLAHAATFQGMRALHHILGEADGIRLDIIPSAVFCQPEAAMVGLTEEQCKTQGIETRVGKAFFRANGKAIAMGEPDGYVKLIAERETLRIVGCHLYGAHAADLIQEVASLMNTNSSVKQLVQTVHAHPTLGEAILAAGRNVR